MKGTQSSQRIWRELKQLTCRNYRVRSVLPYDRWSAPPAGTIKDATNRRNSSLSPKPVHERKSLYPTEEGHAS
jgi:hypothetical protein